MRELDELKQEIDRLRLLAQRDPLTGLLNRSAMEEQVNRLLEDEPAGLFVGILFLPRPCPDAWEETPSPYFCQAPAPGRRRQTR